MVGQGEGWWEGIVREFGMHTYTLLYFKWMANKGLLYSTGNSAQCYVTALMGEGLLLLLLSRVSRVRLCVTP